MHGGEFLKCDARDFSIVGNQAIVDGILETSSRQAI